jgi:hypothetical protein
MKGQEGIQMPQLECMKVSVSHYILCFIHIIHWISSSPCAVGKITIMCKTVEQEGHATQGGDEKGAGVL